MAAGRNSSALIALVAGLIAGTAATLAQLLLWLLAGEEVEALLLRDARLTAALILGPQVLPPPVTFDAGIMFVATLVHFALSILFAAALRPLMQRWRGWRGMTAGALYGVGLYFINLHGFTLLFPWFAPAQGGITLLAHIVFGLAAAAVYRFSAVR